MSFQPLNADAEAKVIRDRNLRRLVEAADSAVAIAFARAQIAASIVRRIDAEGAFGADVLAQALQNRADAEKSLRSARSTRHLLLRRLIHLGRQ